MRRARWALVASLALAAYPRPPEACDRCVLAPGQERALGELLGGPGALPGGCRLDHARVERSTVRAWYRCPAGEAAIRLHHASRAPSGAVAAGGMALVDEGGAARADGLLDALAARVRARGAAVHWSQATRDRNGPNGPDSEPAGPDPDRLEHRVDLAPPRASVPARGALLGALALGVALAVWRARRTTPPARP